MASQITADGQVIAPLNVNNPTPAFDLQGFKFNPVVALNSGPRPGSPGRRDRPPTGPQKPLPVSSQQPGSARDQIDEQLTTPGGPAPTAHPALPFPLTKLRGAYAGNGFNMIWVPTQFKGNPTDLGDGLNDNRLLLNLTTEQWTFGPTLGDIPNRGFGSQKDITLGGLAYMQTVQNVTNEDTGKGDKPRTTAGSGIHFEPGVFLYVRKADFQPEDSIVRMASIPHGTTINAQGFVPATKTPVKGNPTIGAVDTTPFFIGKDKEPLVDLFNKPMDADRENKTLREPKNLAPFVKTGTITDAVIKNPNLVLRNAISKQKILDHVTFEVATGGHPSATLNGGGTDNIAFLAGEQAPVPKVPTAPVANQVLIPAHLNPGQGDNPNAHAVSMVSRFWIETVEYTVVVPRMPGGATAILLPEMPGAGDPHEPPTPKFAVTAPRGGVPQSKRIKVTGTQIQYSQTVNLNFGPLTWPHISCATLVPTDPQPWVMTGKE